MQTVRSTHVGPFHPRLYPLLAGAAMTFLLFLLRANRHGSPSAQNWQIS